MAKHVVVVESPSKAKTINKYLGNDYHVIASFGHVRDLPSKDGSVDPDHNFKMNWAMEARGRKQMDEIAKACRQASSLYLATDPDREGEAISWHIQQELASRKITGSLSVSRVVFHEITRSAVQEAFQHPRQLNQELVDAYLARRALDYLVGFRLSPILWRKLPGARSAGRVQSVALRLICEREGAIETFQPQEFWTIDVGLSRTALSPKDQAKLDPNLGEFQARLVRMDGEKLSKFSLKTKASAEQAETRLASYQQFLIDRLTSKEVRRNPAPPFTTSTLQQEASRKLYFSASRTMQIAQKLYEGLEIGGETVGLITYMRTDSTNLSQDALAQARSYISASLPEAYLPREARIYRTKARNAQEAHEAIRPVTISRHPDEMRRYLDKDMANLYELIWLRTVACQMSSAIFDQLSVDIDSADHKLGLKASGQTRKFDGFLRLYEEGVDDKPSHNASAKAGDSDTTEDLPMGALPALSQGESLAKHAVMADQHFTEPPPRFSEASLVKKMEELGIGRPSTYASILKLLQDRNYVRIEKRRFWAEVRGRLVTAFLSAFFTRYVDYGFTAHLEENLDEIANGNLTWQNVLQEFWQEFAATIGKASQLEFAAVKQTIDEALAFHFFPSRSGQGDKQSDKDVRQCPSCGTGRLSLNFGRYGTFIACNRYPECRYSRNVDGADSSAGAGDSDGKDEESMGGEGSSSSSSGDVSELLPRVLGLSPVTQGEVSVRHGPYGYYVQDSGAIEFKPISASKAKGSKAKSVAKATPKRASLLPGFDPLTIDLDSALKILSLPRLVGNHPETGETIEAGYGRFGSFLRYQGRYVNLPADENILIIGLNRAVDLLAAAPPAKSRFRKGASADEGGEDKAAGSPMLRNGETFVGEHPQGGIIAYGQGRYGPYVRLGNLYASLRANQSDEAVDLETAIELIEAKQTKQGNGEATPKFRKSGFTSWSKSPTAKASAKPFRRKG